MTVYCYKKTKIFADKIFTDDYLSLRHSLSLPPFLRRGIDKMPIIICCQFSIFNFHFVPLVLCFQFSIFNFHILFSIIQLFIPVFNYFSFYQQQKLEMRVVKHLTKMILPNVCALFRLAVMIAISNNR